MANACRRGSLLLRRVSRVWYTACAPCEPHTAKAACGARVACSSIMAIDQWTKTKVYARLWCGTLSGRVREAFSRCYRQAIDTRSKPTDIMQQVLHAPSTSALQQVSAAGSV